MFINWKLIATVIIVLLLLAVVLGNNPAVSRFFSSLRERAGISVEKEPGRPVQFSLALDNYDPVSFASSRTLNVSVTGDTVAVLQEGRVQSNKSLSIINYRGSGGVGSTLSLDGSFEAIEGAGIYISLSGPISLNSSYSLVAIDNLALKSFDTNASGTLTVGNTETRFSGLITVLEPLGNFIFDRANGTKLSVAGTAQKITIPSAGISIG